jgi:orotate phosphoribosyltransferase-like protein
VLGVSSASTAAFANGAVRFNFTGAHTNNGFQIDDATINGTAMRINTDSLTNGKGLYISNNTSLTSGNMLYVSSGSTGNLGGAVELNFTGAHTGSTFKMDDNTASGTAMRINVNALTSGNGLVVNSTSSAMTGDMTLLNNSDTGTGSTGRVLGVSSASTAAFANGAVRFNFTGAHTNNGFQIDDATATGTAMMVTIASLTTGKGLVVSGGNGLAGGNMLYVTAGGSGAYNGAVAFNFLGNHTGISFRIDDATTSGTVMNILANSLTTGMGIEIDTAALTSGKALEVNSTSTVATGALLGIDSASTAAFTDGGVSIDFTGAHTGDGVKIDDVTAAGNAMNIVVDSLTSGNGLTISSANTATTGAILAASSASTGSFADGGFSLNFTGAHTGAGIRSDDSTQTGQAMIIAANALTSGAGMVISSTSTGLTGNIASFTASGNNAAVTGNVLALNMSGANNAGNTLKVDNACSGAGTSSTGCLALLVSTGAVHIGDGTNYLSMSSTTHEPLLAGTARHSKVATLTAEYPGSVLDASGSNNTGTLTAPYDATQHEGYYNWTTTTVTPSQSYDVVVNFALPSDWSAWASSTPITVDTYSTATGTSTITGFITDTSGTAETAWSSGYNCALTPGANNTWSTITGCTVAGTYAANGTMNIHFRLTAINGSSVRLGTIKLSYLSKF